MSFCTLQEIKDWLKITDSSQDAFLTELQKGVEGAIINYCDTNFTETDTTELLDGSRSDVIVTSGSPITSVTGVWFNCDGTGAGGSQLDTENFTVKPEAIYLRNGLFTPAGRSNIRVDYKWGYTSVPETVKLATKMGVEAFAARRGRKSVGISSRGKEGENESYVQAWDKISGLPVEVTSLLGAYTGPEIPVGPTSQRNY